MSLKPGDKARVAYSCYDVNLGKIVEILRPQCETDESWIRDTQGINFWFVRCADYFYTSTVDEQHFWMEKEVVMAECCLEKVL